ncbi:MAG: hypothetical protein C4523_02370 [Myxococcales bacterium]|nr:MAG: hypothetical protein C4523_02370 [Myxococcales bacterium]
MTAALLAALLACAPHECAVITHPNGYVSEIVQGYGHRVHVPNMLAAAFKVPHAGYEFHHSHLTESGLSEADRALFERNPGLSRLCAWLPSGKSDCVNR